MKEVTRDDGELFHTAYLAKLAPQDLPVIFLLSTAAASVARRGYRGSYGHRRRNGDSYEDYQDQADRYYYRGDDDYRGVQHRSHIIVHGDLHNHFNGAGLRQPDAHHADESEADERTYRFNLGPADFGPYGYMWVQVFRAWRDLGDVF